MTIFSCSRTAAGNVFRLDVARVGGGDVHRYLVSERKEFVGARDEVGLAVQLEEDGELRVAVDVGEHTSLGGGALGLLSGLRKSLLAEVVAGSLHVAVAFDERLFAVHHSDRGAGAKLRHHRSSDIRHIS